MLNKGPNPQGAALFMAYLLDPERGMKVLDAMGQPPFIPGRVASETELQTLPAGLQALVEVSP